MKHLLFGTLIAALVSCGGGTVGSSGTGGELRLLDIEGVVVTTEGEPVSGAVVRVVEGSAQTATAPDGSYELSATVADSFNLTIEKQARSYTVGVDSVAEGASSIYVGVQLDPNSTNATQSTVDGKLTIEGSCEGFTEVRGRRATFNLGDRALECSLRFEFRGGVTTLQNNELDIQNSSCRGLTLTPIGDNNEGSKLVSFQTIRIPRQNRDCSARVRSRFTNGQVGPSFDLSFNADAEETGAIGREFSYRGEVVLDSGSSESGQCRRFEQERYPLIYTSSQGGSVIASIINNGEYFLTGSYDAGRNNEAERYRIRKVFSRDPRSQSATLEPTGSVGRADLPVSLRYVEKQGASVTCTRTFRGTLTKQ